MSPEYGATCTMFPIDQVTIDYMRFTGRDDEHLALVEAYAKEQGLWHTADGVEPVYSEYISSTWATSSRRWPGRPGPRTGSPWPGPATPSGWRLWTGRRARRTEPAGGGPTRR
jgi:hypothetical protein